MALTREALGLLAVLVPIALLSVVVLALIGELRRIELRQLRIMRRVRALARRRRR